MFSLFRKRVATSVDHFNAAFLRLCWLLAPARLKLKLRDILRVKWYQSLIGVPITKISLEDLRAYTPIRLNITSDPQSVTWVRTGKLSATHPFFEHIVFHAWLSQIRARICSTEIDSLIDLHKIDPGLAPTGFVFHVSRCGSTLVSNILSVPASCLVLSEPFSVGTSLILSETSLPVERQIDIFRALMSVLGRAQSANQKYLFLKFTSWNVLYLDFIKKVYPEVPWIFLYRRPLEVAVSCLEDQLAWTMANNNPRLTERHLGISDISNLSTEEFYARAIAKYGEAALGGLDNNAMLVNYSDLSESFIPKLLSFFKIEATAEESLQMRGCFQFHSKDPRKTRRHSNDSQKKVRMASPHLKEMVDRYAVASYEALENTRRITNPKSEQIYGEA
jgi:hypothetical protein